MTHEEQIFAAMLFAFANSCRRSQTNGKWTANDHQTAHDNLKDALIQLKRIADRHPDAALIVEAVNAHAALTERVAALEDALRLMLLSDVNHSDYHMRRTAIEQARKALGGADAR